MGALNATLPKDNRHEDGIDWNFWISLSVAVLPLIVGVVLAIVSFVSL